MFQLTVILMKESSKVTTWAKKGSSDRTGMSYPWKSLLCPVRHVLIIIGYQIYLQNMLFGPLQNFSEVSPFTKHIQYMARGVYFWKVKSKKDKNRLRENKYFILQQDSLLLEFWNFTLLLFTKKCFLNEFNSKYYNI